MAKRYYVRFQYDGLTNISNNPTVSTIDGKQVGYIYYLDSGMIIYYDSLNRAYQDREYFHQRWIAQRGFPNHYTVIEEGE